MFLPVTMEEVKSRGWDAVDFVYVNGDAYVDHPSFGASIITRVLEAEGFRVAVELPRGTNTEKPAMAPANEEDRWLWARNKWLLAHPDSQEAKQGAYIGLTGKNLDITAD